MFYRTKGRSIADTPGVVRHARHNEGGTNRMDPTPRNERTGFIGTPGKEFMKWNDLTPDQKARTLKAFYQVRDTPGNDRRPRPIIIIRIPDGPEVKKHVAIFRLRRFPVGYDYAIDRIEKL